MLLDLHSFLGQGKPFAMLGPRNNDGPLEPVAHELAEGRLRVRLENSAGFTPI